MEMTMATKTCPYCYEEIQEAAVKCKHCGSWVAPDPADPAGGFAGVGDRRLYRSRTDRKLAGVCGGIANYFGLDPTLVRIIYLVLCLIPPFPAVLLYIALIFIVPLEEGPAR